MSLDAIEVFVEVVDAQSFTRAAGRLGMPSTTVSAKIARLEERLGVTLIQRTTRRLRVTPAGRGYYGHCVRALAAIAEGERELKATIEEPTGLLRITTPADLAQGLLPPLIERFLSAYPKTSVELVITNQVLDLIAEGIDLAIRVGPLEDSRLIIRKFRSGRVTLWASPAYLARMGTPETPAALAAHQIIRFSRIRDHGALHSPAGEPLHLDFTGRLATDDLDNLKTLILRGNGIGLLPEFIRDGGTFGDGTAPGTERIAPAALVRVLPGYASAIGGVYLAYPAQRFVPRALRAFIAIAVEAPV